MADFESRHMIEALRSGVPSRAVGAFFNQAREDQVALFESELDSIILTGQSSGRIFTGRYGEGKTHMLSTVRSLAEQKNMVVSMVSISVETPPSNLAVIYRKAMEQTYLPNSLQPGILSLLDRIPAGGSTAQSALAYARDCLSSDKLYYVFKAFLNTKDDDLRYMLQSDLEGTFAPFASVRKAFNGCVEGESLTTYQRKFLKTRNTFDYFLFMAHLFRELGYAGWVILFDEAELMGSFGRKTRIKAYSNLHDFLFPEKLEAVYSLFAFSASYRQDVIVGKDEYTYLGTVEDPVQKECVTAFLDAISDAIELRELSQEELNAAIIQIMSIYRQAYDFYQPIDSEDLCSRASSAGYLLRTRVRAVIECLDQLQLYGNLEKMEVGQVESGKLEEESDPELDDMIDAF